MENRIQKLDGKLDPGKHLYVAYGSNLNLEQMASRAPTAQPLGAGYLKGWELVFRRVADIRKSDSDSILPVGFWAITDEDELALDRYEGYPRVYSKININGAMTYVMNSDEIAPPSPTYYATIREGYEDFGLDTDSLVSALIESGGI